MTKNKVIRTGTKFYIYTGLIEKSNLLGLGIRSHDLLEGGVFIMETIMNKEMLQELITELQDCFSKLE